MCPSEWHPELGAPYPPTPNLDLMKQVRDEANALTRFVDWLTANDMLIAKHGEYAEVRVSCLECAGSGNDIKLLTPRQRQVAKVAGTYKDIGGVPPCAECDGRGWKVIPTVKTEALVPIARSWEQLFCEYFGVDHSKIAEEKDALYEAMRSKNAQREVTEVGQ